MAKKTKKTSAIGPRLITIPDGAIYLGRTEYSMRCLIWAGEISIIQNGPRGKMWLDRLELDRWIERKKEKYIPLPERKKQGKSKRKPG